MERISFFFAAPQGRSRVYRQSNRKKMPTELQGKKIEKKYLVVSIASKCLRSGGTTSKSEKKRETTYQVRISCNS